MFVSTIRLTHNLGTTFFVYKGYKYKVRLGAQQLMGDTH